ncbi:hypothetical protein QR680_019365 [Steinernema hermaphroditum]|uniref:Uncharacterized protein n=1 Tax=Steinernema hermaphroditum TaxID=289476 RepID=A0AA39GPN5_9BILA|nr:hypothetical protein QR680_019365 [Steinernema hermaphroditum]
MDDERRQQVQPDWPLIDEVSIPLLEHGVGAFDVLQSCLPSVVLSKADPTQQEWTQERILKMFRIAQLQIQHVLPSKKHAVISFAKIVNFDKSSRTLLSSHRNILNAKTVENSSSLPRSFGSTSKDVIQNRMLRVQLCQVQYLPPE